jgi:myo-inositol-1-phosphate synthase
MTNEVRVAIVGVGNCASSLVQGVEYYKDADQNSTVPGLMHVALGPYHVRDVKFVTAFDVDAKKPEALLRGESYIKHIGPARVAAAFARGRIRIETVVVHRDLPSPVVPAPLRGAIIMVRASPPG